MGLIDVVDDHLVDTISDLEIPVAPLNRRFRHSTRLRLVIVIQRA
jgi:hypothetical protein